MREFKKMGATQWIPNEIFIVHYSFGRNGAATIFCRVLTEDRRSSFAPAKAYGCTMKADVAVR